MSSGGESLRMNRLPPRLPTNRDSVGAVMISGTKVQHRPQPLPPLSSPPPHYQALAAAVTTHESAHCMGEAKSKASL
jgi:hypothetical protein